jgi:hypothetical protein
MGVIRTDIIIEDIDNLTEEEIKEEYILPKGINTQN